MALAQDGAINSSGSNRVSQKSLNVFPTPPQRKERA
ncbi:MAG: hypothetical protein E6J44_06110 [Chloroflexi bacterium]|nr:MAG: hypothetical protein E6J44_06110 [Chloroflexota bacterium]